MHTQRIIAMSLITAALMAGPMVFPKYTLACGGKSHKHTGHGDIKEKFFYKAHLILENQPMLNLAEEQMTKIKTLKLDTKKAMIRQDAEIEVVKIDIHSQLWQDPIDVKAVNALYDKKYELKKAKARTLVEAFANLKNFLSAEQKTKLKEFYQK